MELSVDTFVIKLNSIYNQFVTRNEDIGSIFLRDDVDALMNFLSANNKTPQQYENCYNQGLLHMAAQYDAIAIFKYLSQQIPDLLKDDTNFNAYDVAYENKSMQVLFHMLSTTQNKGRVLNHMMNRFSMFSLENRFFDSFLVLSKNSQNKQFQTNIKAFNDHFRNIVDFKTNSKICLFINNQEAFIAHSQLHPSSIHQVSIHDSFLSCTVGKYHSLLLSTSGQVYESSSIILQNSVLRYADSPPHFLNKGIESLPHITQITSGMNHSVALSDEGEVYIWGQNDAGQIPDSSVTFVETPMKLPMSNCIQIASHGNSTTVLTDKDILFWPYYRDSSLVTHPTRVNTLCYLHLDVIQIGCHDGFNTLLTQQGQLFGYYYYIGKNQEISLSARRLFPSTLQPGCIHALLPSCVSCADRFLTRLLDVCLTDDQGALPKQTEVKCKCCLFVLIRYFLGPHKTYNSLHQESDGLLPDLAGGVEIMDWDSQDSLYCCLTGERTHSSINPHTLLESTGQFVINHCTLRQIPAILSTIPLLPCSSFYSSLLQFLYQNLSILTLFYSHLLPQLSSIAMTLKDIECFSYSQTDSRESVDTSLSSVLTKVYKRIRTLRKRLERLPGESSSYSYTDIIALENKQTIISEFMEYIHAVKLLGENRKMIKEKECLERIDWIMNQTIPTEKKSQSVNKKKKRSKPQQNVVPSPAVEKVVEKPAMKPAVKPKEEDDGFQTVTKGVIIKDAISIKKLTSPSIFEESDKDDDDFIPEVLIDDDDISEWNGLTQEEIRNQKILLEYYKQQQQKKERRKLEKMRSGKRKKGRK